MRLRVARIVGRAKLLPIRLFVVNGHLVGIENAGRALPFEPLYLVAQGVIARWPLDGALGNQGVVPKSGAEHGARQNTKGLFAIPPRLRSHNEEALETVTPRRVEANSPARPHSAVHIGATVDRRRRHEQGHS